MAEVKKVTVEEFDEEGNLVKRTTTEYDQTGRAAGGTTWPNGIHVGDVWPYGSGTYVVQDPTKYQIYNTDHTEYVKIGEDMVRRDLL